MLVMNSNAMLLAVLAALFLTGTHCMPTSFLINVDNIQYLATFIDQSFMIEGRAMKFEAGTDNEKLLEIPLVAARELDIHATIRITVATQPPTPQNSDRDPIVGISDGVKVNRFVFYDQSNYASYSPCSLVDAVDDNVLVGSHCPVPSQYTLLFTPFYCYGACHTAQNGGYVNTGKFNQQLDISRALSLVIHRHNAAEEYAFQYITVEILQ